MKRHLTTLTITLLLVTNVYSQQTKEEQSVVDEGKKLYKSEMASWYGTDVFLAKFPDKRESIGGYFSYADGEVEKCLFFSNATAPKVLAIISFDSTFNVKTAKVDNTEREFTSFENDIYTTRKTALALINKDTLFKTYKNTNLNLIPLIEGDSKKIFVLTGPEQNGVVIFGNDYLITFDKNNEVKSKKQLHKNIIVQEYSSNGKIDGNKVVGGIHTHLPETGNLMTSTDICTLMLYAKFAGWESYSVVSEKYYNIWTCATNSLAVVPKDVFDKINKDQEKRNKKKN
ncbi:MAG: hypothetical protein IPP38_00045 [Bacteroidetes bacterium]|nr:hypothetical protein [Bacteroidota bacterium]